MATLTAKENSPAVSADVPKLAVKEVASHNLSGQEYVLRFAKMSEDATIPSYGSAEAAGADLYSAEDCKVPAKGKYCVSTQIRVAIPDGCYGRVAPRSGLATKYFIDVGAGVIDSDYRGEVKVLLFNFGDTDFEIKKGDRMAQLVCEKFERCRIIEEQALDPTVRGVNGFGSTGV